MGITLYVKATLFVVFGSVPFGHGPDWPQPLTAASA